MSQTAPKTALDLVLEWSNATDRPYWQRDALRRIVQTQAITPTDVSHFVLLCKRARATVKDPAWAPPLPLEAAHVPANPGNGASVALTEIKDVKGVNKLAPDQTLAFAPTGITIVYGDNGAGKSGYARILKRACRARHSDIILTNVERPSVGGSPSAKLGYSVAGVVQTPVAWQDHGRPQPQPHAVLSAISVFDSDCATVHLEKNDVAFRPFGLDIPDELVKACKQVKAALDLEKADLEKARDAIFSALPIFATTVVGAALGKIKHATTIAELQALGAFTPEREQRLLRLTADLAMNPATAAAEQRMKADRFALLASRAALVIAQTNDEALANLFELASSASTARAAATLAATGAFGRGTLPEVGGAVWRALWDAARRYSTTVAYPEAPFPPASTGLICVLCHQPLSPEAITRMGQFEAFIVDDTERHAQACEASLGCAVTVLEEAAISFDTIAPTLSELALHDLELARGIRRAYAEARVRRKAALSRIETGFEVPILQCADLSLDELNELEAATRRYAGELQSASSGPERIALEQERQELAALAWLSKNIALVQTEIERLQAVNLLELCMEDTRHAAVTILGNKIADEVLTNQLRDRFNAEIVGLVGANIRVEMVRDGGVQGTPQYRVRLIVSPAAKVPAVLSEGEKTCVAIAAFLAELATAPHNSTLVFDDPISSLDHKWRHKVAARLVEEAARRQVIVFTHDLVFVNDIQDAAGNLVCEARHIRRTASAVGFVTDGLPWDGTKVAQRVDLLEKKARALVAYRVSEDEDDYKKEARHFYDDLRAGWERALEEIAFSGVVMRHRDYINAKELRAASALSEPDCEEWSKNFQKCCDLITGHDASRVRNRAMPEPPELLIDVQALGAWATNLKDRQRPLRR